MGYSDRDNRRVKIHIDLAAMRHNLNRACLAAPGKKTFCVVKSDAYGHGLQKVVPALRQSDGYAVANVQEGLAVRNQEGRKPVLVLQGFQSTAELRDCIRANLWPVIHHAEQLTMFARNDSATLGCWVKFDTGMGRLGFEPADAPGICRQLAEKSVRVIGIMTHLASADRLRDMSTDRQLKVFRSLQWPDIVDYSVANSAALLTRHDSHYDWIRPGIMLYGANPMDAIIDGNMLDSAGPPLEPNSDPDGRDFALQPAMRVSAPVIAVRNFKRGDRIGYAGTYECTGPTKVAVVGAGYGDGYPRRVPPGTCVMLGDRRCPILGRVSMDSMSVDVTGLSVVPPLDYPVTLWGHSGLRVDEIARRIGTIPYELLCGIRGKRSWLDPSPGTNVTSISDDKSV